ncbi:ferroptosis suppressor protein 1 isoform X2 [Callithrix jacchus]|uniref:ferroptosis suppressor protein 1 isoform X1 n=1 Tax=Callithrix jacchus TaxID=9483 RepID=UPI0004F07813|nr:ferroptosis suppressor protein 1 isoform X1 [Callithrix jacchus]
MGSQVSVESGSLHVVIVGGGFGGIAAASQLQALHIPFTLVDMKDSFHHNVAALRASVERGFAKKTFISYSVTFKDNFRQGHVVGIDLKNQTVLLQGGEALPFSHLILATGSTGPFPGKVNEVSSQQAAIQAYEDMVRQVQRSRFIVVVGGGSAGVEMAAEIKTEYPEKEVGEAALPWNSKWLAFFCIILGTSGICSGQRRLELYSPKLGVTLIHSQVPLADKELLPSVRQEVKEILLRKGVQLLLSERVNNLEELPLNEYREYIKVQTDKGTEVATNLVILCTGIKINSSAYRSAFENRLASSGALRVNEHLQVEGHSNVYAIGDCADLRTPKMAYLAGLHANIAVANIVNSVKQRPLQAYKPGALTFLLSMGRNDGVGQISGFYVGRLMVRLAKSRDLFISTSWKTMKQSPP